MSYKRNLFVWCLYDFANSFVLITFLLYFSKWLVVERGVPDSWYNLSFVFGSIVLLVIAPRLGAKADRLGTGRFHLIVSTVACAVFYLLSAICAVRGMNLAALGSFGLGNFFYQLSFVFYNPLLDGVAAKEDQGKASGLGFCINYVGQISGIFMSLPLVSGKFSLGVDPLIAPPFPGIAVFVLFSIPLLLDKDIFEAARTVDAPAEVENKPSLRALAVYTAACMFIISFFFCSNALTTLVNNFSIFTSSVFSATNEQVSVLSILIIIMGGAGSWLWGWLSDRWDAVKVQTVVIWSWVILIPGLAWIPSFEIFSVLTILAGLCLGGVWSVSRRLILLLVPKHLLNYTFGIYAVSERAAAIVGPLAWSAVLAGGGYRWALTSLVVFEVIAGILMLRVIRAGGSWGQAP